MQALFETMPSGTTIFCIIHAIFDIVLVPVIGAIEDEDTLPDAEDAICCYFTRPYPESVFHVQLSELSL